MWELDHREGWALKTWCFRTVVLEKSLESPSDSKEIKPVNPKGNEPWIFIGRTDAEALVLWPPWCEEPTDWKRPWCWERLRAGGEVGSRGWGSWLTSLSQWTWVLADSGRLWRMGKPGVLYPMGVTKVWHDWATEQQHLYIINVWSRKVSLRETI